MEPTRFVETGNSTFFGEYLYDQVIPRDHFLRKLRKIVDWEYFTKRLIKLNKGQGAVGRPPFDPAMVLKVELIAYLYKLSERQVEVFNLGKSHAVTTKWQRGDLLTPGSRHFLETISMIR